MTANRGGRKPMYGEEESLLIMEAYKAGKPVAEMARERGCYPRVIYRILKLHGAMRKKSHAQIWRCKVKPEQREEVKRRYEAGERAADLAAAYGCSVPLIRKILSRVGAQKNTTHAENGRKGAAQRDANRAARGLYPSEIREQEARRAVARAVKQPYAPPIGLPQGTKGNGHQQRTRVSLRGFPPLPGEPGYVFSEGA